jgi:hypothetical protein
MNLDNQTNTFLIGKKVLYSYLRNLGFHHSWGNWIFNNDRNFRLGIKKTKKSILISMSTNGYCYDKHFQILKTTNAQLILKEIMKIYSKKIKN